MAVWLAGHGEALDQIALQAYRLHHILHLWEEITPSQAVLFYMKHNTPSLENIDRLQECIDHNTRRGHQGLRPVLPLWYVEQCDKEADPK